MRETARLLKVSVAKVSEARRMSATTKRTGVWRRNEQGHAICEGSLPKEPGVYLFIEGRVIRYVGAAQTTLHSRMRTMRDGSAATKQIGQFMLH